MESKTKQQNANSVILASGIGLAIVIFSIDYVLPQPLTLSVLYVVPVLLTLFLKGRKASNYITIFISFIASIDFLFSVQSAIEIIHFIVSLTGIWIGYIFVVKYKNHTLSDVKNRERLRALFDFATEAILIANKKGEIVMINPMAEKQFGYEAGELEGKQIELLIPSRMSERHVKHREKFAHNPHPRSMGQGMELFATRKNGTEFPVEISLSNFSTEEGPFVIAFIIDISQRKKSEALLLKEKELAQMYLDIAPVIFMVIDKNQSVILINQNGCRILGYTENEIIGKNWFELITSESERISSRSIFNKLMEGEISSIGSFESEVATIHGEKKLILWKNTILRDEKGQPVSLLYAGEDVTESKRQKILIESANAELKKYSDQILKLNTDLEKRVQARTEELAALIHQLEHTNFELANEIRERQQTEILLEVNRQELRTALEKEKDLSELKSRFVTMASHEFRTPLSTILTSVSLISKYNDVGQDEKRFKHIDRIKSAVSNLTSILNDFLSLGKLEEGKVQYSATEFDLPVFSQDLVNEMREVSKKGQSIIYEHQGDQSIVFLDKNLTRNICINLLSNAIKYSNEGSRIDFKTIHENDKIVLEVTDHGIGIPESEQQHIFERFFRAGNASNIQGTGLGLNIVKKYVELLNGEVGFKSVYGKGTTFKVILPTKTTS